MEENYIQLKIDILQYIKYEKTKFLHLDFHRKLLQMNLDEHKVGLKRRANVLYFFCVDEVKWLENSLAGHT